MPKEANVGRRLLRAAGVVTLVLVGTPAVLMLVVGLELMDVTMRLSPGRFAFWFVAAMVYAVAFWQAARLRKRTRSAGRILTPAACYPSVIPFFPVPVCARS